jgi:WD40 repeat protein
MLATVSDDGNVRLWDPATSKEIDTIHLNEAVRAVAFSPDGSRLVAGTRKGTIRVFDTKTGKTLMAMPEGHKKVVMALAWSADGKRVASASGDHTVKIWDVSGDDAKEVATLTGHTGGVYTVAFDPTNKPIIASGSWDHTIRLWDTETGKEVRKLEGHHDDIWSVTFSADGKILASGSEDRTAKLWDPATGAELRTVKGQMGTIYAVSFSPDGSTLATAGRDGKVKLWDIRD